MIVSLQSETTEHGIARYPGRVWSPESVDRRPFRAAANVVLVRAAPEEIVSSVSRFPGVC